MPKLKKYVDTPRTKLAKNLNQVLNLDVVEKGKFK